MNILSRKNVNWMRTRFRSERQFRIRTVRFRSPLHCNNLFPDPDNI